MASKGELDLRGVVLPTCLLECKNALVEMDARHGLDVLISDPHVVEDLVKIIKRSAGLAVRPRREGDHYRLHITGQPLSGEATFRSTAQGRDPSGRQKK